MADRYWVGGTGTWDASTTTNWATTSGGAGGASAPTSADNAYFDGNSDAGAPFTVTINSGAVCADVIIGGSPVTVLDQTMTLAGNAAWTIYGSLYFPATNLTRTYTGAVTFAATTTGKTITTNAIQPTTGQFIFNGVGGEWTLGSALTKAERISVINGTFKTGDYDVSLTGTSGRITSETSNVRGIYLGASVLSLSGGSPITFTNTGSLTFDAGTSLLSIGSTSPGITGGGVTFYDIIFTNTTLSVTITGNNTFNNVTIPSRISAGVHSFFISGDQIITGALRVQSGFGATFDITDTAGAITAATVNAGGEGYNVGDVLNVTGGNGDAQLTVATLSGTAIATVTISTPGTGYTTATGVATTLATSALNPNRRALIASTPIGTACTITAAAVNITNADFRNITGAGAATWSDSGRTRYWGNCLGNSGITFSAGVSKYRIGTGNWSATQWAASSGGSPAVGDFPLAQDTCVFDANTTTGTHTLDASYNIGSLNMSALTVAVTLATGSTAPTFYGNVTLDADVTLSGTGTFTFAGQGTTQTITSAGRTFTQPLTVNSPSGTVALADALTTNLALTLSQGELNLNNQTLTALTFDSDNTNVRSIAFGSGKIVLTGNNGVIVSRPTSTGLTYTGAPRVELSYSGGTGTRSIRPGVSTTGATESNSFDYYVTAGTDSVNLTGSGTNNVYGSLDFTGFSGTTSFSQSATIILYRSLTISSSMSLASTNNAFQFSATSGTQQITSAGKTFDQPITINAPGASVQLVDNLTLGSSRAFTLTAGTLDINDKTLSTGTFSSSNSNVRSIDFGAGGKLECVGSGTVFNATTSTNLTFTGTGTIDLTSASTKTFAGGGGTYPPLNQGGSGTLLITGANTFADITNTVQPTTITFPSGVTTSVQDFNVNGTPGNLVTLNASTPGSRAFLNKI